MESKATFKRAVLVLFSLLFFTLSSLDTADARRRNRNHRDKNRHERCDDYLSRYDRQSYFDNNQQQSRQSRNDYRGNNNERYKQGKGEDAHFDAVREKLHNELAASHRTVLSYGEARERVMLELDIKRDKSGNSYVWDYYCQRAFRINTNEMPNSNQLNIEHTWPQSRFSRRFHQQKSDLHHLFPTDSWANQLRGHMNFGYVEKDDRFTDANCKESRSGYDKNGQMRFQPPASHRGAIARALFYFAIRYRLSIDAEHEAILRQWHIDDPVTAEDIERNNKIAQIQGNRNPFIDDPSLVDKIETFR